MLIPAFIVGNLIVHSISFSLVSFVLAQDSSQTQALILRELSHGVVQYRYNIGGQQYTGQSQPSREQWDDAKVGSNITAIYCPHHPSWSSLKDPIFSPVQLLLPAIALVFEFFFVATIINPKGKYALQLGLKEYE
ncbi:MAG TPA: DUF3592 domain-containing protein [Verrucomicrobiae bacterium]|jgi:hypothetical protein